jgi:hypothetical protein
LQLYRKGAARTPIVTRMPGLDARSMLRPLQSKRAALQKRAADPQKSYLNARFVVYK